MVGRKDSGCAYTHESVQQEDIASDSYNPITKVRKSLFIHIITDFIQEHPHIVFRISRKLLDEARIFNQGSSLNMARI